MASTTAAPPRDTGALRQDRRQQRRVRTVRSGAVVAALGVASVAPFYALNYHLQSQGRSAAAIGMALMHMERMSVFWAFPVLQATGIAGLIWAYIGVALGLMESGTPPRWWPVSRVDTDRIHRHISLLVLVLILAHAVATVFDAMGDGWLAAFVPFRQSWAAARLAYNLGIFALYLALLVGPTYYLRRRIKPARWRFVHRFALIVYVLSVWHTLLLGIDFSYYPWVRPLTWLAQIPLLALFIRRLLSPARRTASRRQPAFTPIRHGLIACSAAAMVGIAVLVVIGHSDLPLRVGNHDTMPHPPGNAWLPIWLRLVASAVSAAALGAHTWHLRARSAPTRAWHVGHVLMAAGMLDMFLPTMPPPIAMDTATVVFAAAAAAATGYLLIRLQRERSMPAPWLILVVDLAAMAYMFSMPPGPLQWISWVLLVWFILQAAAWAAPGLRQMISDGRSTASVSDGSIDPGTTRSVRSRVAGAHAHATGTLGLHRILAVMSVGMGYMVLAMHIGS